MQQPDKELGKCVIAPHPADHDPREGELFAELQKEIDRLASLHAAGTPDWPRVAQLGERYLREETKDLTVAVWLGIAWVHLDASGPCATARLLVDLVRDHWEVLLPSRPRARRNQMVWFEEQIERIMSADQALDPLQEDAYAEMLQNWRELDAAWQARDETAPSLASLALRFSHWPVQEAQNEPQVPAAEPSSAPGSVAAPLPATAPAVTTASAAPAAPAGSASTVTAAPPPASAVPAAMNIGFDAETQWDSPQALERTLEKAMDSLAGPLEAGIRQFPANPLWYRLNRTRVWAALETAPPAQQGETRIPAPNDRQRERLAQLMAGEDRAELLTFAESQLGASRFWLDLNLASFIALTGMPDGQAAAAAVQQETAALLARMPALQTLCFADGSPFADTRTREWLSRSAPASGPAAGQPLAARSDSSTPRASAAGLFSLSAAISVAAAQTESAQVLLASALARLHDGAQQVALHAFPEHPSS